MRSPIHTHRHRFKALLVAAVLLAATAAPAVETPTFSRDVAPILFEKCVQCHRPNQAAPMSLLSYREARPWARGMARAVENRDMPPWSAESEHVVFRNDLSLSPEQIATITSWAAGGAPEGDPADLPPTPTFLRRLDAGRTGLRADPRSGRGSCRWRRRLPQAADQAGPRGRALGAGDRVHARRPPRYPPLPGDLHDAAPRRGGPVGAGEKVREGSGGSGVFGIWTAGMPPYVFPEGTGRVLGPGTSIMIDSHYHPFGEATSDETRIGIFFGEGELQREVATVSVANTGIRIPRAPTTTRRKASTSRTRPCRSSPSAPTCTCAARR